MFNGRKGGLTSSVFALAMLVAACGSGETASPEVTEAPAAPETTAVPEVSFPSFTVPTSDGGQIEWTSLQGQDVVLWFWAPW